MKQIKKSKLTQILLIVLVLVMGLILALTKGFNKELKYKEHQEIKLEIGKEYKKTDIKEITNEIFDGQDVVIQDVDEYGDTVLISTNNITDEQKTNLVNKINEKYQIALAADSQEIQTIPQTRIIDILNHYFLAFGVSSIIILVYMAIRYRKLNALKVIFTTVLALVVTEAVLFAIFAITQIPFGKYTVALVFIAYVFALAVIVNKFENKLTKIKLEEKKQK